MILINKYLYFLKIKLSYYNNIINFEYRYIKHINNIVFPYRKTILKIFIIVTMILIGRFLYIEIKKENHVFDIWFHIHAACLNPDIWRPPEYYVDVIEAFKTLDGDDNGEVSMYGALMLTGYAERIQFYTGHFNTTNYAFWRKISENAIKYALNYYKDALMKAPDNPHFKIQAMYLQHPGWVSIYTDTLEKFPNHPYNAMMAYNLAFKSYLSDQQTGYYRELYEELTGKYLKKTRKERAGYRPIPKFVGKVNFEKVKEGLLLDLTPGEKVFLEELDFFNSDRGKIGLYVRVMNGNVKGKLITDGDEYGNWQHFNQDESNYRFFPCDKPEGVKEVQVVLQAGENSSQIVIRDYYPMIGNPRFYRTPSPYFITKPLKKLISLCFSRFI